MVIDLDLINDMKNFNEEGEEKEMRSNWRGKSDRRQQRWRRRRRRRWWWGCLL